MKPPVNNSNEAVKGVNDDNSAALLRRSRGREVSSRYMLPTASSLAASSFNSISDGFSSPLRRPTSPNSSSLRRQKNGSSAPPADCTRSVSAERRRPAKAAAEEIKSAESAKASSNADAARHPMRGLWPSAAAASNNTPSLADQLGNEKLKRIAGGNNDRAAGGAALRRSESSANVTAEPGARPKRTSADTPRRSSQENTKPVADEYQRHNQNARPNQKEGGNLLQARRYSSKSMESLNVLGAGKSLGRAASSLNLRPQSRSSSRTANDDADYLDRLQAIVPARLSVDSLGVKPRGSGQDVDVASSEDRSLTLQSDDGTGFATSPKPGAPKKNTRRGSYVPARFLQDTFSSLRRLSDTNLKQNLQKPSSPADRRISSSISTTGNGSDSSRAISPGRFPAPSPALSMPLVSSPVGAKTSNGPRGLQSLLTKTRAGTPSASAVSRMGNMLNFGMDIFRGRKSTAVQEETTYQLRMLHNRWLQWRFVNARAQAAHEAQIVMAEDALFHVWLKASQLRTSVVAKRMQLQKARHELKLKTLLAAHAVQLEDWSTMEKEHVSAIIGTMECLEAAILKLPLVGGAKADIRTVIQVMGFAVDVTNGIREAATKILPKAKNVNSLLMELVETVAEERSLLRECMELLAGVASLQMEENSLRIQLIQLQQSNMQELNNQQSIKLDLVRPGLLDLNYLEL